MRNGLLSRCASAILATPRRSFLGLLLSAAILLPLFAYMWQPASPAFTPNVCARNKTTLRGLMASAGLGVADASADTLDSYPLRAHVKATPPVNGCPTGTLPPGNPNQIPADPPDIVISTACVVAGGPGGANNAIHYFYGNINIINGGSLDFQ